MTPAEEQALAASILNPWYEREREGAKLKNPVAWRAVRDIADLANWIHSNRVLGNWTGYQPEPETEEEAELRRQIERAEADRIAARSAAVMSQPIRTMGHALVRVAVTTTEADLQGDP